jgi:DNA-binding XRE family transcriptional regulator
MFTNEKEIITVTLQSKFYLTNNQKELDRFKIGNIKVWRCLVLLQLGTNLKKLREQNNLTQEQLATIIGVSRTQYTKYESSTHEPNIRRLILLADYFNVSLDELVGRKSLK